jgi:hypothetical protein
MVRVFRAEDFFARLNRGEFDGRIHQELGKLSSEEVDQLAVFLATLSSKSDESGVHADNEATGAHLPGESHRTK